MIYNIKELDCKYKTGNPVLKIENLQINKGEIVFFLGASGVGKSTILETLGLMNNTIHSNSQSVFDFSYNSQKENMLNIWGKKESFLANFRNKHLSFIFQSTNLFPTLNALDNVLLTPLLQNKSEMDARNKLRPIFKEIFPVKWREILNNKKISEMSGGQKQRLAFVRAIASDYNILLADEPTGNLDWANANNLMTFLIKDIREKGATSVIVSHDINLAVEHADKIIYIDKKYNEELEYYFGYISDASTYVKQKPGKWCNSIKYDNMNPPELSGNQLSSFFKEEIIKQNQHNV